MITKASDVDYCVKVCSTSHLLAKPLEELLVLWFMELQVNMYMILSDLLEKWKRRSIIPPPSTVANVTI